MKIFLDSTDVTAISECSETGLVDGVTTNPSLVSHTQCHSFEELIQSLCNVVNAPVSVEVTAHQSDEMLRQAEHFLSLSPHIVIKVPLTPQGLKTCRTLSLQGAKVNVTLCFSAQQALLAAKSGATYISPFVGRLEDAGHDGLGLLHDIRALYDHYHFTTQILAASIRNMAHIMGAAQCHADVVTIPPKLFWQMYAHPLTQHGIEIFDQDWKRFFHRTQKH